MQKGSPLTGPPFLLAYYRNSVVLALSASHLTVSAKGFINGVQCTVMGFVNVVIVRDCCCPAFRRSVNHMLSVLHWLISLYISAIFPYYSHIHTFLSFLGCVYDGGDIKNAHPSYTPTEKKKPIIICGDFNVAANPIDLKNPKANQNNAGYSLEEREKFQELLSAGFIDTYRTLYPDKVEYSWWSYRFKSRERNAGWRLDYFLLSEFAKDKVIDSKIHTDIMGSDHCPVSLEIEI